MRRKVTTNFARVSQIPKSKLMPSLPAVLTIAGSDNSAGAGAQADLKTISALGGYALTAITCVVAEIPGKVSAIQPVDREIVADQIRLSFDAFPVAAVKTGMLYSREIIETVCVTLEQCIANSARRPALVVDPVMVATSGDPLLRQDAVALYRERLIPMAAVITPNLDELGTLLGEKVVDLPAMRAAGLRLAEQFGCAVLAKGGHFRGQHAIDYLIEGFSVSEFKASYVSGVSTHGTGCAYSAAIAAGLAKGLSLYQAVSEAKLFITQAIEKFLKWESSRGEVHALDHFARLRSAGDIAEGDR
jgi:hydroxymethylpyrimidine/phosphomethylpyrimidine kinase